ncbi:MAG: hypothetical protein P4M11_03475 [Candidatus Pacebacteria bacterium]|nr:hypothetical protein [Candidatus Paceibacterota bacterium]
MSDIQGVALGCFITFLILVNLFIVGFVAHYMIAVTPTIGYSMAFLSIHALFGAVTASVLLATFCWTTRAMYRFGMAYFRVNYKAYIAAHFAGLIYYSCMASWTEKASGKHAYGVFIFYLTVNLGVFWWTCSPALERAEERMRFFLDEKRKAE